MSGFMCRAVVDSVCSQGIAAVGEVSERLLGRDRKVPAPSQTESKPSLRGGFSAGAVRRMLCRFTSIPSASATLGLQRVLLRLCPGCPERVIAERESHGRHFVVRAPLEGNPHALHDPDGEGVSIGGEHLDVPYTR
jgi:hypothetical protein